MIDGMQYSLAIANSRCPLGVLIYMNLLGHVYILVFTTPKQATSAEHVVFRAMAVSMLLFATFSLIAASTFSVHGQRYCESQFHCWGAKPSEENAMLNL